MCVTHLYDSTARSAGHDARMDGPQLPRVPFDAVSYGLRSRQGPCFVCAILAGDPVERMYCLSLGGQQGNAHLHWHLAPLPPGAPYDRQQYYALMAEKRCPGYG